MIKWLLDLLIAFSAFILLSPFKGLIRILIWVSMGKPVLFSQVNPGLHRRPFTIYGERGSPCEKTGG